MTKRILISTGEVSGDLLSGYLIRALYHHNPKLDIVAVGGPEVEKAGATLLFNSFHMGAMGIIELLPLVATVLRLRRVVFKSIKKMRPDLVILVDCNGFNSGLAARLKKKGIPTVCFILPRLGIRTSEQADADVNTML